MGLSCTFPANSLSLFSFSLPHIQARLTMMGLSPGKQICFPSVGSLSFFQHRVGSGIFPYRIHHIRTENRIPSMCSPASQLRVSRSSEVDERSALCALKVLPSEVSPLFEASKCWRLWDGERNTLTGLCSSKGCCLLLWLPAEWQGRVA